MNKRIGFISFRFAGTDGVSLETIKWAQILEEMGFDCFFMGGELETPGDRSYLSEMFHFKHPEILDIYNESFSEIKRSRSLTKKIHHFRYIMKKELYEFIRKFKIDLLIPQNALTIPLNIPLGLALTEIIAETGMPVIAHHHDFFWERKRFLRNCVWDYINQSYPPHLHNIQHVVINSSGQNQLALRTGISSTLIPNVMDFEKGPDQPDGYAADVRESLGISPDEYFFLQPTRVVQRKGIEHAIELAARLGDKVCLLISHASGDEGYEYQNRIMEYADLLKIKAVFVQDQINDVRGLTPDGRKIYTLQDVYPHADLVTYPSLIEGFGNAFLEALLFKTPILVNNYSIYATDIRPKGFRVIEMDDFVSKETILKTREVLENKELRKEMTEFNYKLGLKFYSFHVLREKLKSLIMSFWGGQFFGVPK